MATHRNCTADLCATPIRVYDPECGDCLADYLRGRGLHEDAVKLAVVDHAGPGAAMLAERFPVGGRS